MASESKFTFTGFTFRSPQTREDELLVVFTLLGDVSGCEPDLIETDEHYRSGVSYAVLRLRACIKKIWDGRWKLQIFQSCFSRVTEKKKLFLSHLDILVIPAQVIHSFYGRWVHFVRRIHDRPLAFPFLLCPMLVSFCLFQPINQSINNFLYIFLFNDMKCKMFFPVNSRWPLA